MSFLTYSNSNSYITTFNSNKLNTYQDIKLVSVPSLTGKSDIITLFAR